VSFIRTGTFGQKYRVIVKLRGSRASGPASAQIQAERSHAVIIIAGQCGILTGRKTNRTDHRQGDSRRPKARQCQAASQYLQFLHHVIIPDI
jgi:hypothetical protein